MKSRLPRESGQQPEMVCCGSGPVGRYGGVDGLETQTQSFQMAACDKHGEYKRSSMHSHVALASREALFQDPIRTRANKASKLPNKERNNGGP
jgi:hypothetical protein